MTVSPKIKSSSVPELPPTDVRDRDDTELIELIHAGDERALETLIQRYRELARWKSRDYFFPGSDQDDLVQEAMIGLYKAIRDFDLALDIPFRAFASICITRHILTAMRSATRSKHDVLSRSVSLDLPVLGHGMEQGKEHHPLVDNLRASGLDDPANAVIVADEIEAMRDSIKTKLSDMEVEIFRLHLAGSSYQDIANALGFHAKGVDNALQRIRRKLRRHLDERQESEEDALLDKER